MASTKIWRSIGARSLGACVIALTCMLLAMPVAAQTPAPLPNPNLNLLTNGFVYAIVRQADGGVVFGGNFSSVNGVPRNNVARLMPDGTLDLTWNPSANGDVRALAVDSSGAVYAGGLFTTIGGQPRNYIAKLSGSGTGAADPTWNPSLSDGVLALAVDSSGAVYVGGFFSTIGGQLRSGIAKLSSTGTGAADATWNPSANRMVRELVVDSTGAVYASGDFTAIGGQSRNGIAKLSTSGTGAADASWNPSANGYVRALALDSSGAVYVGGLFSTIGGQSRNNIAKLSGTGTGAADASWNPSANDAVYELTVESSGAVYAGGYFTTIGGQPRSRIAKLSASGAGAADASWNPSTDGGVTALAVDSSGAVYVGGYFTTINGQMRLSLGSIAVTGVAGAAIDAERTASVHTTALQPDGGVIVGGNFLMANGHLRGNLLRLVADGTLDLTWNPSANSEVRALAVDSSGAVYVGGYFTTIGGQSRNRIAKLSGKGTGAADATWNPSASDYVQVLALDSSGAVYAGGQFTTIGGQSRNRIAKLSGSGTGAADASWNPSANSQVSALALDSSGAVYAGGFFSTIGGLSRSHIAKLSGSGTGAADTIWNPSASGLVFALAVDSTGTVYAGGGFSTIGGLSRDRIAKLSGSGTGAADAMWNPLADSNVTALAMDSSGAVYAGGLFTTIGGQPRNYIAKLSGSGTGAADPTWNPSLSDGVLALAVDSSGAVYAGGTFDNSGGQPQLGIAAFPSINLEIFRSGFE